MEDNKLKYQIEMIKNTNYLLDNKYINNCFNFKGNLNENKKSDVPFCITKQEYFNYKTKEIEKIFIYTTNFQLNLLSNCI